MLETVIWLICVCSSAGAIGQFFFTGNGPKLMELHHSTCRGPAGGVWPLLFYPKRTIIDETNHITCQSIVGGVPTLFSLSKMVQN